MLEVPHILARHHRVGQEAPESLVPGPARAAFPALDQYGPAIGSEALEGEWPVDERLGPEPADLETVDNVPLGPGSNKLWNYDHSG
jgi:hypothetical protein